MALNPPNVRFPFTLPPEMDSEVRKAIEWGFNGLTVHEQAFDSLKSQLDSLKTTVQTVTTSTSSGPGPTPAPPSIVSLGVVNDQLGATSYTTQQGDNGAKIIVGNTLPVTVILDAGVTIPWFCIIDNDSSSMASLSPSSGLLYGSNSIPPDGFGIVYFDGTNFWVGVADGPVSPVPFKAVHAAYTMQTTDYQIRCNSGPYIVSMMDATSIEPGTTYAVKNVDSGAVTVAAYAGQYIDNDSSQMVAQWDNLEMRRDSVPGWIIV